MSNYSWQDLHIGDRVRVVDWPPELKRECLHHDTVAVYDEIISDRIELIIHFIDSFGIPYGKFYRSSSSLPISESVALNHSKLQKSGESS